MGTVDASFGVLRIEEFLGFFNKQLLCSTSALIHINKSIEPQITTNNGILVSPSIVGIFFSTIVNILWFSDQAYHSMIHKLFYENQD
jgi:Co/Zn/Cd efflux system component